MIRYIQLYNTIKSPYARCRINESLPSRCEICGRFVYGEEMNLIWIPRYKMWRWSCDIPVHRVGGLDEES